MDIFLPFKVVSAKRPPFFKRQVPVLCNPPKKTKKKPISHFSSLGSRILQIKSDQGFILLYWQWTQWIIFDILNLFLPGLKRKILMSCRPTRAADAAARIQTVSRTVFPTSGTCILKIHFLEWQAGLQYFFFPILQLTIEEELSFLFKA